MKAIKLIREAKDTRVDYAEQFEIALLPDKGAVTVTQLFGYNTKYPIFIKADGEIANKIKNIKKFDIDVTSIEIIGGKDDAQLKLVVDVDGDEQFTFNIILGNGKEKLELIS